MTPSSAYQGPKMMRVTTIKYRGGHALGIVFADGRRDIHDFSDLCGRTGEMVRPLRDPAYFAHTFLDDRVLTWPNGYDWDPDVLHELMLGAGELSLIDTAE